MSRLLIENLAGAVTGVVGSERLEIESIVVEDGRIHDLGVEGRPERDTRDVVIDARGAVACPGLIDTHSHVVFGDWTPRQHALGWIESSVHGGVTSLISASEVHLPGRPHDVAGVKALAVAANRAFRSFRPGGMKVYAGSVIVEPGLTEPDFRELAAEGVWLAKVGFGKWDSQADAAPTVRIAQQHGFIVMAHTGGASIPGSSSVSMEDIHLLKPDIIGHANGGTTALPDSELERLFADVDGAIQIVQAGNLRSALAILALAQQFDALDRLLVATDTPSGTGVMPLGMLKSVTEVSSLGQLRPTDAWSFGSGNAGRVMRLEQGVLKEGAPADIILIQTPMGGSKSDPLETIAHGDLPAIVAVVIDGEVAALRSRNTPAPTEEVRLAMPGALVLDRRG